MIESIQGALEDLARKHKDEREHVFQVKIDSHEGERLALSGRVLERANLDEIRVALSGIAALVDLSGVAVLRRGEPRLLHIATNLTSMHKETSFLSEMVTQALFGTQIEVLDEQDLWGFARASDGYLGWTYLPYLRSEPILPATHLVTAPVIDVRADPRIDADLISRTFGGTFVHLQAVQGEWAHIRAHVSGWVPLAGLRDLQSLPRTTAERRAQMVTDAHTMLGVPYLWGGDSANGIDCSGFARLVHRWSGLTIRRDADMQMWDGQPVAPETMRPGDLAFFSETYDPNNITHVGVSLGGWRMIHSSRSRNGVYVDDIQQVKHLRENFISAATYLRE